MIYTVPIDGLIKFYTGSEFIQLFKNLNTTDSKIIYPSVVGTYTFGLEIVVVFALVFSCFPFFMTIFSKYWV